jgi:hypothetical protein
MTNNLINFLSKKLIEFSNISDILFLSDSLTSHWNRNFPKANVNNTVETHRRKIPRGTIAFAQPLDSFFNHEMKYFVKKFTEKVILNEIDIDIRNRLIIKRLFSLI